MEMHRTLALVVTLIAAASYGCPSSESGTSCTPGTTQACLGAGRCGGAQTCLPDGTGYTECDCGGGLGDGGPGGDGGSDGGSDAGNDAGNDGGGTDGGTAECDPLNQTGCEANEKCTFVYFNVGDAQGETRCAPAGDVPVRDACTSTPNQGDDCEAGLFCAGVSGVGSQCGEICELDGGTCSEPDFYCAATSAFSDLTGIGVCSFTCDVISQNCPGGRACELVDAEGHGGCGPAGTATQGQACDESTFCAPGYTCAYPQGGGAGSCHKYCRGHDDCPAGGYLCQAPTGDIGVCVLLVD